MRVLGNHVAVNPVKHADRTESGIWLAPSPYSEGSEGIVRAIGSGIKDGTEYRRGDRVFIEMYKSQAHVFDVKDEVFIFLDRGDIVGLDVNGRYHPINDHIILKPAERPRSAIVRPENYDADEGDVTYHTVYLVGSGVKTKKGVVVPFDVKMGDKVITIANIGRDVMAGDGIYKMVKHSDILAIIT